MRGHREAVVSAGETARPRQVWQARAAAAGLVVKDTVTRHTPVLVAADPDTMSVRARKAAEYGVPVVHPAAFARMLPD